MKPCSAQALHIKKAFRASERDSDDYDEKLRVFINAVAQIPVEKLVFLDESGVNLSMMPLYGRTVKGQRAYAKKPAKRGTSISLIGAINYKEMCALYPYAGAIDTDKFLHFIENSLMPTLNKGDTLIMDNLRVHHVKIVEEKLKSGGINILFLPPYSPEMNPIEEV